MRELLITPASNVNANVSLKDETKKVLVFFKSPTTVTVFHVQSGKEEDIPLSHVSLFNEDVFIDKKHYRILEKNNHL